METTEIDEPFIAEELGRVGTVPGSPERTPSRLVVRR